MQIKQKIFVIKDGHKIEGIVSSIEEKSGFRGYKYRLIHINVDGKLCTYNEWDVIE